MKYKSTRGKVSGFSFEESLFSGYADDGGLFVPESIPRLNTAKLQSWFQSKPPYLQIVQEVVRLFIAKDEIPDDALAECVRKAYAKFDTSETVALSKECKTRSGNNFKVAELFHGQTASFKDYALSLVGQFMKFFLAQKKKQVTILVSYNILNF
jgi:threonine synthase